MSFNFRLKVDLHLSIQSEGLRISNFGSPDPLRRWPVAGCPRWRPGVRKLPGWSGGPQQETTLVIGWFCLGCGLKRSKNHPDFMEMIDFNGNWDIPFCFCTMQKRYGPIFFSQSLCVMKLEINSLSIPPWRSLKTIFKKIQVHVTHLNVLGKLIPFKKNQAKSHFFHFLRTFFQAMVPQWVKLAPEPRFQTSAQAEVDVIHGDPFGENRDRLIPCWSLLSNHQEVVSGDCCQGDFPKG